MNEYEKFIEELHKLPKIDTAFVYSGESTMTNGDVITEAVEIRHTAETRGEAEEKIMSSVKELIDGNKAWVRLMPTYREVDGLWHGRTRIAVIPND